MAKKYYKSSALLMAGVMAIMTACDSNEVNDNEVAEQAEIAEESGKDISEETEDSGEVASYDASLFDTSYVHSIDIDISEDDWTDLLENPTDKTKYEIDITIDGEKIEDVSFATKGNTSLSSVAADENSDRYSFKVNFGKYVDGQTYHGLDKLNLNNVYSDNTYIKDYLSYQLFNYMGVDAPLASFANITVNGEPWGLYLAVEDVSEAFLTRTGNSDAELYKPETSMLAGAGNFGGRNGAFKPGERPEGFDPENMPEGFDPESMPERFDPENMPEGFDPENMPEDFDPSEFMKNFDSDDDNEMEDRKERGDFGGFGGNDNGASLKYTDDELDSYSDIFDNAETDVSEEDEKRVIEALKNLSDGNVAESVDIESVIDYFVVHNFVMNYDSYTGNMLHNYYLLEEDGILQMVPWDYNLAFGGFMNGRPNRAEGENSATTTVNYGIDSPLSGAETDDRPMWSWIVNNSEYLEEYHESFDKLSSYVLSDEFSAELDRLYEMILPYVAEDATAFVTEDEFISGFETLFEFITLRAQSVQKQLGGELATVTDEQNEEERVDAGSIEISNMGSQGGFGQRGRK